MNQFTNYAIRRIRDGTETVFLEMKFEKFLVQCVDSEDLVDVIPRCIVPTCLKLVDVPRFIGKSARGEFHRVMVPPYEVFCFRRKKVYHFSVCFGFKPYNKNKVIGITQISSTDIL